MFERLLEKCGHHYVNPDILYVDDETDNLIVFEATFGNDFNIHVMSTAREALQFLEHTPVPVLVADQRMPGMTGIELFEIVRDRHPHTKRIVLTGYTEGAAMLDAINKGQVFYFLTKPWQRESLAAVLIRALEAHRLELKNSVLTEQLVAAQRFAMLGHAAAKMTHEISNGICILPLIEYVDENHSDDEVLMLLATCARTAHERLVHLLGEVHQLVHGENRDIVLRPMRLADIVRELVAFLRFDDRIEPARLELEIVHEPLVLANQSKIQQVLLNLINNAFFAIRNREDGRVTVRLEIEGDRAVLSVADNGCGIPAEHLLRIWDPYFTTKGKEGTGLGLAICRELVESHGGELDCQSGSGMKFTIRLPLHSPASNWPASGLESLPTKLQVELTK